MGRGRFDWTWKIKQSLFGLKLKKNNGSPMNLVSLSLHVTPRGKPTSMVADTLDWLVTLSSTPYSKIAPNVPAFTASLHFLFC